MEWNMYSLSLGNCYSSVSLFVSLNLGIRMSFSSPLSPKQSHLLTQRDRSIAGKCLHHCPREWSPCVCFHDRKHSPVTSVGHRHKNERGMNKGLTYTCVFGLGSYYPAAHLRRKFCKWLVSYMSFAAWRSAHTNQAENSCPCQLTNS